MSIPTRGEALARALRAVPTSLPGCDHGRDALICRVMLAERRLQSIAMLYAMATADALHMNPSDLLCLGILGSTGPITAGQLADIIGLSTGAVTGLVDRLERLDLVRRERDEQDRRRVVLHLNADRTEELDKAFVPMLEAAWQHLEQFSDDELRVIDRYVSGAIAFMREATARARAVSEALPPHRRRREPDA